MDSATTKKGNLKKQKMSGLLPTISLYDYKPEFTDAQKQHLLNLEAQGISSARGMPANAAQPAQR